jgi:hypothetical protein
VLAVKRKHATGALLAALAAVVLAAPLPAGPPMTGSGTGMIQTLVITSSRAAGGNVIQERTLTGTVAGTMTGTFVEHVRGVIHSNGHVTFSGTLEFTGTLAGCGTGTLLLRLAGQGAAGLPVTEARLVPIMGPRSTIAAHGVATVSQVGPFMTYEVRYTCR